MSVKIRMARQGARKHITYLVVAVDSRKKRDGAYLEKLGQYLPRAEKPEEKLTINHDSLQKWLKQGAQVSQTVGQLLKAQAK